MTFVIVRCRQTASVDAANLVHLQSIRAINAGSSSIEFSILSIGGRMCRARAAKSAALGFARTVGGAAGEDGVASVGHGVVRGSECFLKSICVEGQPLADLDALVALVPLRQLPTLEATRAIAAALPGLHRHDPEIADLNVLSYQLHGQGVRRQGIHGLTSACIAGVLPVVTPEISGGTTVIGPLASTSARAR